MNLVLEHLFPSVSTLFDWSSGPFLDTLLPRRPFRDFISKSRWLFAAIRPKAQNQPVPCRRNFATLAGANSGSLCLCLPRSSVSAQRCFVAQTDTFHFEPLFDLFPCVWRFLTSCISSPLFFFVLYRLIAVATWEIRYR